MDRKKAVLVLALLGLPRLAGAQEHLVSPGEVADRFQRAEAHRAGRIAQVQTMLETTEAKAAASWLGADPDRLRQAVRQLSDQELRDLADRAQALTADPAAGASTLFWLIVIGAILILTGVISISVG